MIMEKQNFTQEQAQEMFKSLSEIYDDYEAIGKERIKKSSMLDIAYYTGIGCLLKRIKKENMN